MKMYLVYTNLKVTLCLQSITQDIFGGAALATNDEEDTYSETTKAGKLPPYSIP